MDSSKFDEDVQWEFRDGYMSNVFFPREALQAAKTFEFRDGDILSASYAKTGQTWLLAILTLVKNAERLEKGEELGVRDFRSPIFFDVKVPGLLLGHEDASRRPGPRIIKTHFELACWKDALDRNPETKVIQTIRNPKDTLVSFYHFMKITKTIGCFNGSWDEFFEMAKEGRLPHHGDYFKSNAEWYEYNKNRKNSLVLIYEEMKKDLRSHVKKIAEFLGVNLSEKMIDLITEKTTFKNMAKDPVMNPKNSNLPVPAFKGKDDSLMRKGEVGQWQEYMNETQLKFIEQKTKAILEPLGLKFDQ